jgi:hypothetical protein
MKSYFDKSSNLSGRIENKITLVTGLWDIGRDALSEGWSRPYSHYLDRFAELLDVPYNMIIFGDKELQEIVFKKRNLSNTKFIVRNKDWFKQEFYDQIQNIRLKPSWYSQASWLKESAQGSLDMYNPIVMSKVFLLNDARLLDPFSSKYMYWIDAGITSTVHSGYFYKDKILDNFNPKGIVFITFPYKAENEIHGFDYKELCILSNSSKVSKVCRGGFFGGDVNDIADFNEDYHFLMTLTLEKGYMGTEESLFTILLHRDNSRYSYYSIKSDGLLSTFFEDLKNRTQDSSVTKFKENSNDRIALYILTYNSPNQLKILLESFKDYDKDFIDIPDIYLINNSTDNSKDDEYQSLCDRYGILHLKKDVNLGICGGRQYASEHADAYEYDFHLFFEDDMNLYIGDDSYCRNGFNRKLERLLQTSIKIVKQEKLDFLKLSFSEFFGDNSRQWAWFNVPVNIREEIWPKKTNISFRTDCPYVKYELIASINKVPYAVGEVYYSNWPQIVSKEGNRKMFLETKWKNPYEQTWMSHIFQETIKNNIKAGVLLASPIEHNRFDHYPKEERKEN